MCKQESCGRSLGKEVLGSCYSHTLKQGLLCKVHRHMKSRIWC